MSSKHKLYRSMIPVPSRSTIGRGCLSRSNPFLVVDALNSNTPPTPQEASKAIPEKNKSASIDHLNFEILSAGVSVAQKIEKFQSAEAKPWKKKDGFTASEMSIAGDAGYSSQTSIQRKPSSSSSSCASSSNVCDIKISNTSCFTNVYNSSCEDSSSEEKGKNMKKSKEENIEKHCTVISMSTAKEGDKDEDGNKDENKLEIITPSAKQEKVDDNDGDDDGDGDHHHYDKHNYDRLSGQLQQSHLPTRVDCYDEQQVRSSFNKQLWEKENKIRRLSSRVQESKKHVAELYRELEERDERISAYVEEIRLRKSDLIRMSKRVVELDQQLRHFESVDCCNEAERLETRSVNGRPRSQLSCCTDCTQDNVVYSNNWIRKFLKKSTFFSNDKKNTIASGDHVDELRDMLREKEMIITDLRLETKLTTHRLAELEASLKRKQEESYLMLKNSDYLAKAFKAKLID